MSATRDRLAQAIFEKRPGLRRALDAHGSRSLQEYVHSFLELPAGQHPRQHRLIDIVTTEAARLWDAAAAEGIGRQLHSHFYVHTADHMGPFSHPFFVHANLIAALPYLRSMPKEHENILVFATGNVSLGNSSLPRTHLVHLPDAAGYTRLHLLPAAYRSAPVYGMRPYTEKELAHAVAALPPQLQDRITHILGANALQQPTYAAQMSVTNTLLWQQIFADTQAPTLRYMQLEDIVVAALLQDHIHTDTEISQLIFSHAVRTQAEELFDGIPGAFALKEGRGTFLFWLLPTHTKTRVALWSKGNQLVSTDGAYVIDISPTTIAEKLSSGELIPNTMLSLLTLSMYYGLHCTGGFSQVDYLPRMQAAYAQLYTYGTADSPALLYGDFSIAFLQLQNSLVPATGLDLLLYKNTGMWQTLAQLAARMTVFESFSILMPELYTILYPAHERQPELARLTSHDMLQQLGFAVPACGTVDI